MFTFLTVKTTKERLHKVLKNMVTEKQLKRGEVFYNGLYTLPEYSSFFKKRIIRTRIYNDKKKKIKFYLKVLSLIPQIKFIGLSGTMAMSNAEREDDIDLFVITSRHRLWTGRFIAWFLAHIMGLGRQRKSKLIQDKVCLNLFFDEKNLKVPEKKRTFYVAHEILQLKPLINKDFIYERFLKANDWVYEIFPNAKIVRTGQCPVPTQKRHYISNTLENLLKRLQLTIIKRHQTSEIITDTQLWFFPDDFEKKIRL